MEMRSAADLIDELLSSSSLTAETAADLRAFQRSERLGQLSESDFQYVRALHIRMLGAKPPPARRRENGAANPAADWEPRAREAIARAERAEARAADLERKLSQQRASDSMFREAKVRFAKLFHPNNNNNRADADALLRAELFKEFWAELESIESGGQPPPGQKG